MSQVEAIVYYLAQEVQVQQVAVHHMAGKTVQRWAERLASKRSVSSPVTHSMVDLTLEESGSGLAKAAAAA